VTFFPSEIIDAATRISWLTRLRLLFARRHRVYDGKHWVDYKRLGHHVYIVDAKP